MESNTVHNPVFLIFPPEVTVPEFLSTDYTATAYEPHIPFPKFLATKLKIFGTLQILLGMMNFSFGLIFLFTFEKPYPRFPFIFVTGYPFWSSILFITSGAFLVALERKATETLVKISRSMNFFSALAAAAGVVLLAFSFILDHHYLCGYAGEISECNAVTALFVGILILMMIFSIIELLISMSFAILTRPFDCCDCEEWC